MSLRGRCAVCGGPEGKCQQDYLEMLVTSRSTRATEHAAMGNTITAAEHIYRDIVSPGGTPQRELAYAPGDEIPAAAAAELGVDDKGRQTPAAPAPAQQPSVPDDKARRGPRSKSKAKAAEPAADDTAGDAGTDEGAAA